MRTHNLNQVEVAAAGSQLSGHDLHGFYTQQASSIVFSSPSLPPSHPPSSPLTAMQPQTPTVVLCKPPHASMEPRKTTKIHYSLPLCI